MDTTIARREQYMSAPGGLLLLMALNSPVALPDMLDAPAPKLMQVYTDYKLPSSAPLLLREAHEDWNGARARMAREPIVKRWIESRREAVERWMANRRDKSAWIAGWGHDLVDAATCLPMQWTPNMPEPPPEDEAAAKIHGAWVYYQRSSNIAFTLEAARLWRLTGDSQYRDWSAAQLDFYAANYERWPEQQHYKAYSRMMGQSLDEATNGILLADAMRLLSSETTSGRMLRWHQKLFKPLLINLERSNIGRNNIAVWQGSASAILALEIGDRAALHRALESATGVRAMLRKGVQADFTWFEPSLAYTNYTLRALATLFVHMSLSGHGDRFVRERLLTQNMIASLLAVRFGDGSIPALGDTSTKLRGVDPGLLIISQRTMPLSAGVLPLTWETLLDPVETAPLPLENKSRVWSYAQFAMLRADNSELFTHWGHKNTSHAQHDTLSWEAQIGGAKVTGSAGTATYSSELFRRYLRTPGAHNVAMVDGKGQKEVGPGTLIGHNQEDLTAQASGYVGTRIERSFRIDKNSIEIRTTIESQDSSLHRLGEIFNTECVVTPNKPLSSVETPAGEGFDWWKETRASEPSKEWLATLNCGNVKTVLKWQADHTGRVFLSSAPDATGPLKRTALYFEAQTSTLTTRLNLARR